MFLFYLLNDKLAGISLTNVYYLIVSGSILESRNWQIKTESVVEYRIARYMSKIIFLGEIGTVICGEHFRGVGL